MLNEKRLYGFDSIENKLRNAFYSDRLHHCIMLTSVEGSGKLTFLKRFAAMVLSGKDGIDNDKIPEDLIKQNHLLINENSHTDFAILNTESFLTEKDQDKKIKEEISVGQVRSLINFLQKTPLISKNKAVIVDSIDKVNNEGQNTILKTLEEPARNTFIFLICHRKERVLSTIFSRSCVYPVEKLSFEDWCRGLLDNVEAEDADNIDEEKLEKLYVMSNRSIGSAISIISNNGLDLYDDIVKFFAEKNILRLQKFFDSFDKNKDMFYLFKMTLEIFFQDLINYSIDFIENKTILKNKKYFDVLAKRNPLPKVLEDYRTVFSLISNVDVYNMSKKHCLNVIFCSCL
jgi:DNA polymerase III delta prime subunit